MSSGSSGSLRRSSGSGSGAHRHGPGGAVAGGRPTRSAVWTRWKTSSQPGTPQRPTKLSRGRQRKGGGGDGLHFPLSPSRLGTDLQPLRLVEELQDLRVQRAHLWPLQRLPEFPLCTVFGASESSPDEPEKISLRGASPRDNREEDAADWLGDVCIGGVKVESPREYLDVESRPPSQVRPLSGASQPSHLSLHESLQLEDWEDEEENVDSLITKKLLELYSEYQIEELARCTSDSVFLNKSEAINQLINSLAEEHKMGEQEAECRLVRGIIRISTRKSPRKRPAVRRERTLSDSGNDTMRDSEVLSFSNNNDYKSNPNIQISELTSLDKCARELWRNNAGHTSRSPTCSPSPTETNSSGVPLIRTSVRT